MFTIDKSPGASWLSLKFSSENVSAPYILITPVPSP